MEYLSAMIRKTVIAIIAAAAILPFVSCNKEGREAPAEADGENLVTITISASTHAPESEVKAALQSDGKVFWEDGDANYDEVSRGAQHYYYIKDASISPGTATNWYIKATHKIPGAHGATHTYTCSSITSSYSPFLWE